MRQMQVSLSGIGVSMLEVLLKGWVWLTFGWVKTTNIGDRELKTSFN